jgi:predicted ArsR family transcriptional regulator
MDDRASTRLLYALKAAGPQTAGAIGKRLGMTAVGARQHLARMLDEKLVTFEDRRETVGRPKRIWSIGDEGNKRFPDNHAGLTLELIGAIKSTLGEKGLDKIIEQRERQTLKAYRAQLDGAGSLKEKAGRLAKLRSEEGYMADLLRDKDGFLLVENHCPICVAAKACQGFCRSELQIFRDALGSDVSVERTEHIVEGARRCAYRIRPAND